MWRQFQVQSWIFLIQNGFPPPLHQSSNTLKLGWSILPNQYKATSYSHLDLHGVRLWIKARIIKGEEKYTLYSMYTYETMLSEVPSVPERHYFNAYLSFVWRSALKSSRSVLSETKRSFIRLVLCPRGLLFRSSDCLWSSCCWIGLYCSILQHLEDDITAWVSWP